jgi:hypothetical protein
MLEHLILSPLGGLCNRLRAIASARRLCRRTGAKCSVIWNWGDFGRFFVPLADADVVRFPPLCAPRSRRMNDTERSERAVDVRLRTAKIRSGVVFWGSDETRIGMSGVADCLPHLHPRLAERVAAFTAERLAGAVGFHMRRTDHSAATANSPDTLFLAEAEEVVAEGRPIFLATDNLATEAMMVGRFGRRVITYPRRKVLVQRWPRPQFDATALEDDLLDLFLLARTEYVVGCKGSSFSGVAMALNGSPLCKKLVLPGTSLGQSEPSRAA